LPLTVPLACPITSAAVPIHWPGAAPGRSVQMRFSLTPSLQMKSSSSVPVSPCQLARMVTTKRRVTCPERSSTMPWPSISPSK
jgi:hypothetical protein